MRGSQTKLFHAIVGLGVVSGVACGSVVQQEITGGTATGSGGDGGSTNTGSGGTNAAGSAGSGGVTGSSTSTTSTIGFGGQAQVFDAGIDDAQTWDVVPIK